MNQENDSAADVLEPAPPGAVSLRGWIGARIDACISNRVMKQDIGRLVQPFVDRQEHDIMGWRCEYWGKWFTSAALGYDYQPTPQRRAILDEAVRALLATQSPDGYIGTYRPDSHLGIWDIWGRKYVLLGLIAAFDLSEDPVVLNAACRVADHLLTEAPPGQVNITTTGADMLKGLAPSSILEPMVLLYQRTGRQQYLDLGQAIVASWEVPNRFMPDGLRLVSNVLAGVPPSHIASGKAYEMMSCFEGLCELYRATGRREYLDAARQFAGSIRQTERMLVGSGSNQELWCDGVRAQTQVLEQPQETCVTVTWMKLCLQLLRLTGDPAWADELEVSLYNALAGAQTPAGEWWSYFSPLTGERAPSPEQHADVGLSCCVANGPRGLLLTPRWAVMSGQDGPVVNLYAPGAAALALADGTLVRIVQSTNYPVDPHISLTIHLQHKCRFTLSLRIPAWSRQTSLSVNGESLACLPGAYVRIEREWSPRDEVVLSLDLRGRAIPAPSGAPQFAVMRGPVVLALDNRLVQAQDVAVRLVTDAEGGVQLTPSAVRPAGIWMAFDASFEVRPSHYFNHHQIALGLCDFASAGNAWNEGNLYRVWLPQPLFLAHAFVPDTWKLMVPELKERPAIKMVTVVDGAGSDDKTEGILWC